MTYARDEFKSLRARISRAAFSGVHTHCILKLSLTLYSPLPSSPMILKLVMPDHNITRKITVSFVFFLPVTYPPRARWHIGPPQKLSMSVCLPQRPAPLPTNPILLLSSPSQRSFSTLCLVPPPPPLFVFPSGLQFNAVLVSLALSCLKMRPMNFHLPLFTS